MSVDERPLVAKGGACIACSDKTEEGKGRQRGPSLKAQGLLRRSCLSSTLLSVREIRKLQIGKPTELIHRSGEIKRAYGFSIDLMS